jgi:restriction endonuclease S subunit
VTWSTKKLKYIIQNFIGGGTPSTDNNDYWTSEGGFPWVTIRDITKSDAIRETERKITASGLNSKNLTLLPPGTILYSMYASVGKVSKLLITATTNQAILGLFNRENQVLNDYLKFSLEAFESFVSFLFSSNTQNNINEEKVKNIILPLPPISEQASITKVLFAEIDLMDNIISRSQEMIELLKEKRQAIITNAVTKGLDPNVPMKDSGIEWIGQIPEHWKIIRIKSVSKLNPSKSEIKDYTDDTKVPFFPMESIGDDGYLRFTEFRSIYEVIKGYTHFRNGDVVVAKITPCF